MLAAAGGPAVRQAVQGQARWKQASVPAFLWAGGASGQASPGQGYQVQQPQEASLLVCFSTPHPRNVLELIEFFEEEDRFYLVFEKMRGGMWGPGGTSSRVLTGCRLRASSEALRLAR